MWTHHNSIVDANTKRHLRNFFEVNWWRNWCICHMWRWWLKDKHAFSCFSLHAWELTVRVKGETVISGRAVNERLSQYGINQLSHKTKWTADAGAAYIQLPQWPPAHQGVWLIPCIKDAHKAKILLLLLERYTFINGATEILYHSSYQKGLAGFSFQDKHLERWFDFNNVGRLCLSHRSKSYRHN